MSDAPRQGRRDAGAEQINELEDGMVERSLARRLLIGCWTAAVALEDFLREKEDHLNLYVTEK